MYNSPAIHFKVMVLCSINRRAILAFFGSPAPVVAAVADTTAHGTTPPRVAQSGGVNTPSGRFWIGKSV